VLALLAFVCFPVLAQAETVYETESTNLPGGGGGNPSPQHKNTVSPESSPTAHQTTVPGEGSGTHHMHDRSSKSGTGPSGKGNPSTPGGGGEAKGKPGKSAVGQEQSLQTAQSKPAPQSTAADDSSPLVPILIAVAVLAAISVGAVMVRQRRGSADGGFSLKRG
jgi:cobalamin biosynthesis Mg chelatase CobN